jgi:hypothetical protein
VRRKSFLAAPIVACTTLGFAATTAGARLPKGIAMIRITAEQIAHARVGIAGRAAGRGGIETSRSLLYNKRIRVRPIGHSELSCVALTSSTSATCTGVFFLPRGKLVVLGPMRPGHSYEVPVVGGTGLYANVRGTLKVISLDSRRVRELLVFTLKT